MDGLHERGVAGLASLPMYDFAELREPTDALWSAIAKRLTEEGIAAPAFLSRDLPFDALWTHPALLLAQTCGYPLVTALRNRVALVATPRYCAPGCDDANYRSAIVVRSTERATVLTDFHGRRCAMNSWDSNSGMNMLRAAVAPFSKGSEAFFSEIVVTGSHAGSVQTVAKGDADVAAIDCVTWSLLQEVQPAETKGLRVLDWTEATPGLPLITSLMTDATARGALLRALSYVESEPSLGGVRAALRLDGFTTVSLSAYGAILALEDKAQAAGYSSLR